MEKQREGRGRGERATIGVALVSQHSGFCFFQFVPSNLFPLGLLGLIDVFSLLSASSKSEQTLQAL